jgi:hypothetical protein
MRAVVRRSWRLILLAALPAAAEAQAVREPPGAGVELQAYPAGLIGGLRVDLGVPRGFLLYLTGAYNFTDRRDLGEHDQEEGGGYGAGAGAEKWFRRGNRGWYLGARTEVWQLRIDWQDRNPPRSGRTRVTVVQPTVRAGHAWLMDDGRIRFQAGLAVGAEVNARTRGEAVGEGAILLGTVSLTLRL